MGEVYTCTDNAKSISNDTIGMAGDQGFTGPNGPTGNPWAVGIVHPSTLTSFVGKNYVLNSADVPFPSTGNVLQTGDRYLNSLTGEWFIYSSTLGNWVAQSTNLKGNQGPPNYAVTEVSFTKNIATGWTVSTVYDKQLVGHVIWPGSNVAGAISSVKVALSTNTQTASTDVILHLVNLGPAIGDIDDIVVAAKTETVSGDGSLGSMQIVDLNIIPANVPANPEMFGLFVTLSMTGPHERQILEQLTSQYSGEIAVNYKQNILKSKEDTRNSFYNVLSKHGLISRNEFPEERNKRIQEEREAQSKTDSKTQADVDKFSEDSSTVSGAKNYNSFDPSPKGGRGSHKTYLHGKVDMSPNAEIC